MTLVITTHRTPDPTMTIAVEPQGEIVSDNAYMLRDRITAVLAATRPRRIVVDLSAVPAIDEAGLGALRSGCDAAADREASLVLVDPHPMVRNELRRHGLTGLLDG
ncbi:STAS domain-containing protein [Micromonospora sp. CPCC 206061]|uniref:STAS domain-containing protein n=1 Tax=Micromonospora sp. CPCC 206061 TaxID=3122410 RepID=UPI002FEF7182